MIIVVAGDPGIGFIAYGPFENEEEVAEKTPLWSVYDRNFWELELEIPTDAPSLSATERRTKDGVFVVLKGLECGWSFAGPFNDVPAARPGRQRMATTAK